MRRREFIALVGGSVAAWPLLAQAQQSERKRIGALVTLATDDPETRAGLGVFRQGLKQSGWNDGNTQFEYRVAEGDANRTNRYVSELISLAPDVIFATGTANVGRLLQANRTVPIVFIYVADPVGAGFVQSLARPGGNATAFIQFDYGLSAKWLELLKKIAPSVTRAAILRDPGISSGTGQWGAIQTAAPSFGLEVSPVNAGDPREIERDIAAYARSANSGLIVTAAASTAIHGELIMALAAHHKLPAVYYARRFTSRGGLTSYGPDIMDQYRRAAGYVDRVLKGEKPADLPVQAPTKFELIVNLKTEGAGHNGAGVATRPRRRGARIGPLKSTSMLRILRSGPGTEQAS